MFKKLILATTITLLSTSTIAIETEDKVNIKSVGNIKQTWQKEQAIEKLKVVDKEPNDVFKGKTRYVPAYQYDGHIIWGLTAFMLVELLNVGLDAGIPMKPRPEHESDC